MKTIFGLQLTDRVKLSQKVQPILSEFGCNIKTRIGLHDVHDNHCDPTGVILLETIGEDHEIAELEKKLSVNWSPNIVFMNVYQGEVV